MARRNPPTGRPPGRPKVVDVNLNALENIDDAEIPEFPAGLGQDGQAAWRRIWASGSHLNPDADYLIVQELCFLIEETAVMRRALALGASGGGVDKTYRTSNRSITMHPYVNQIKDNRAMIMSWMGGLGFGALERKVVSGEDNDGMKAFNDSVEKMGAQLKAMMAND